VIIRTINRIRATYVSFMHIHNISEVSRWKAVSCSSSKSATLDRSMFSFLDSFFVSRFSKNKWIYTHQKSLLNSLLDIRGFNGTEDIKMFLLDSNSVTKQFQRNFSIHLEILVWSHMCVVWQITNVFYPSMIQRAKIHKILNEISRKLKNLLKSIKIY
jgi:hypothetical protein